MSIRNILLGGVPACALLTCLVLSGCTDADPEPQPRAKGDPANQPATRANVGTNIWLEVTPDDRRRVLVSAEVCLTRGPIEQLLTIKGQKEHEAIFAAEIDAKSLHAALVTARAKPGSP